MYLANELIQKGMSIGNETYQRAFEPVIGKALINLFEGQLRGEIYKDIKQEILKVINLWVKGRYFNDLDELREKLKKNGIQRAQLFSWNNTAENVWEVIEKQLNQ